MINVQFKHNQRVQRRMVLNSGQFFAFLNLIIVYFVVAICDLAHDVEAIVHRP